MTKDTNVATCDGQPGQDRTITKLTRSTWNTTDRNSVLQILFSSIPRLLEAGLTHCIKKVNHWTRLLERKAAAREARDISVYDIIEAGPRHRFKTISHTVSNCTLGLGYGMGAAKFVDSCKAQGLELPSIPKDQWPELDRRLMFIIRNVGGIRDPFSPAAEHKVGQIIYSDRIVNDWRTANAKIVQKQRDLESIFRTRAMANKETVSFRLPSGRIKTYWNPMLVKELTTEIGDDGEPHPSFRIAMQATVVRGKPAKFLTGGNLLENIVQASCRDIMTYGAVELEQKFPWCKVLWTVYDEVITEVPDEYVDEALASFPEVMCKGDLIKDWTEGLPLEVEGGAFDKYCK